jgi:hypothetical protein
MKKLPLGALQIVLLCTVLFTSCAQAAEVLVVEPTQERAVDGWGMASLDEVGIDEELITEAVERIGDGSYQNVHSILIIKDGVIAFEAYFSGYTWDYNGERFRGELTDYDADTLHNRCLTSFPSIPV